jgi:hypothetical protein
VAYFRRYPPTPYPPFGRPPPYPPYPPPPPPTPPRQSLDSQATLTRDHLGVWRRIVIKNVRCVPTFSDTLISVDQFWQDSQVDTIFNSTRCIAIPGKGEDPPLDIPFERKEHLYKWAFIPTSQHASLEGAKSSEPRALKATIHRPNSTSFLRRRPV